MHTHAQRQMFLFPGNAAFSLDFLVTLFSFIESKRMHCSYKLHMFCWNQQSNRAVSQGNKRYPEAFCPQREKLKKKKRIQTRNTWGNLLHSTGINFALQVAVEEDWMGKGILSEVRKFFPSFTLVSTLYLSEYCFSVQWSYSQFLNPYLFCRLSSSKDANHPIIMYALIGLYRNFVQHLMTLH